MLVCSVVLRPQRATLGAAVYEIAEASDAPSINAAFAILADDPGAASDHLDAFVGSIMLEAANAAVIVNAGSIRNAAIVEQTNAGVSASAAITGPSTIIAAAVAETATAISVPDATISAAIVYAAVLEGTFVEPSGTLLGTEVLDSGPVTVFEP